MKPKATNLAMALFAAIMGACLLPPEQSKGTSPTTGPASQWGKASGGLQTRLTLEKASVPAGRAARAILDVRNVSDSPVEVAWCGAMGGLVEIVPVKADAQPDTPLKPKRKVIPSKHSLTLQPHMQINVWDIRIDLDFDLALPGTYRIRWPAVPPNYATKGRAPPPSNTARLKITTAKPGPDVEIRWLDGHAWSIPARGGMVSRLTAPAKRFAAGKPIRMRIEIQNTGGQKVKYYDASSYWSGDVSVTGPNGKKLLWLVGPVSTASGGPTLGPGGRVVLDQFDLASYYYLRKPGRYAVQYRGADLYSPIPPSRPFEIEVVAGPAAKADGDPVGKLLAALPKGWSLWGSTRVGRTYLRPGLHWSRVRADYKQLVHSSYSPKGPGGQQGPRPINVWLAHERAKHAPWQASSAQWDIEQKPTKYLGTGGRYHVYIHLPPGSAKIWPTAAADISKALAKREMVK